MGGHTSSGGAHMGGDHPHSGQALAAEDRARVLQLREELNALSVKEVRKRAAEAGVSHREVEAAIHGPRAEIVALILAAQGTRQPGESSEDEFLTPEGEGAAASAAGHSAAGQPQAAGNPGEVWSTMHGLPGEEEIQATHFRPRTDMRATKVAIRAAVGMGSGVDPKSSAYSYHQADVRPRPPRSPASLLACLRMRVAGQAERAAKSPQAHPTSAALYSIWRKADLDGNGYLSEAEIKALNSALKTSWSFEDLWKDGLDMYEGEDTTRLFRYGQDGLREIGFGAFVQIYNARMGSERRRKRIQVKAVFEKLDTDRTGTLTKEGVAKLVRSTKKLLKLLPPDYHAEDDWHEMTLGADRDVTFADFDTWWKNRMGLVEADTPVIPEYFVHKLSQLGTSGGGAGAASDDPRLQTEAVQKAGKRFKRRGSLIGSRNAGGLWEFLTSRLRLMARMRMEWGNIHEVYGHTESIFGDPPVPKWIRDPESNFSAMWDLAQVVFLLYVSITVPYRAALAGEIPFLSTTWWFDTMV